MSTEKAAFAAPEMQSKDTKNLSYQQVMPQENNPIDLIFADIEQPQEPQTSGMFKVMSVNEMIRQTVNLKDPEDLFFRMVYEHEITCLFGDSNCGKSILAVQMGDRISRRKRTIYFDCELSDKQFQMRYTDKIPNEETQEETVTTYQFSDNFFRATIDPESITVGNYEDGIISQIEAYTLAYKAEVVIIDNITFLCTTTEKAEDAGKFMIRLLSLKKKYGWTVIVIAHTPKRDPSIPISQDSMAGSKKLANFFDAIVAIGNSSQGGNTRYVKQVKARSTEIVYGAENVALYEIQKTGCYLHFEYAGISTESEHLKQRKEGEVPQEVINVLDLQKKGKSQSQIAAELGIAKSRVQRIEKKYSAMYEQMAQSIQSAQSDSTDLGEPDEPSEPQPRLWNDKTE